MKFRGKIAKQGKAYLIQIPKALHLVVKDLLGKELIIEVTEIKESD